MKLEEYKANSFTKFGIDWALLTAGVEGDFNTMTIGWGGFGTIWNKPAAFLLVKPNRYTFEFISRHDEITVSFYDDKYRKALGIFGSVSGREVNKAEATGFTPKVLEHGVTYEEAAETVVCQKLFMQQLDIEKFPDLAAPFYSRPGEAQAHYLIIAEVKEVL